MINEIEEIKKKEAAEEWMCQEQTREIVAAAIKSFANMNKTTPKPLSPGIHIFVYTGCSLNAHQYKAKISKKFCECLKKCFNLIRFKFVGFLHSVIFRKNPSLRTLQVV